MPCITSESLLDMQNRLVVDELMYDKFSLGEEHKRLLNSLTDEQRVVYDKIISAARAASVRSKAEIVLNVASSGIASLLLLGGRTSHSICLIPIQINEDSTCNMKSNYTIAELLSKTKLIIWDEAPMLHRFCFEALDRTLRDVLRFSNTSCVDMPFGGKVVVLGGTTRNVKEIKEFSEWLLKIEDGDLGDDDDGESIIKIPDELLITKLEDPLSDPMFFKECVILTPKLSDVAMLNEHLMSMIPGEERTFFEFR
ncbi:uncharacterized protein LOC133303383 [Gastrolobium bilobum]|uniref:uncharacterized protein LOC133303383 n=1 Tax=Gastrolobium bilobum TaxID=150636 RepID=UPI002AB25482|nr:uncharacterized protein LOC133303383 [Gastrolobium bilobum]